MLEGSESEVGILRLLLENAPSLTSLKVLTSSTQADQPDQMDLSKFSDEISKKISTFKWASPTAIIEFHDIFGD
jgi:hypothetical protein